jgi:hypothetical protein
MKLASFLAFLFLIVSIEACSKKPEELLTILPSLGSTISFSSKTATSVVVTWGAAADDITAAADLQYKLVYSTNNNITTAADAQANGTVKLDWTANTLTSNLTGLTSSTLYYFAVLVKDGDGNIAIDTNSTTTLCTGKVMFLANVSNGNLGGSAGADTICNNNKPTGFSSSTFKAMLGDSTTRAACWSTGNDNCSSSSTGRAGWVLPASQNICTSDYSIRIGTTTSSSLLVVSTANTLSSSSTTTFTGFNIAWGNSTASNCTNWTSTSSTATAGSANGVVGTGSTFIAASASASCGSAGTIYCVEQ